MKSNNKSITKLLEKYQEISRIGQIASVVNYDTAISLPQKGSDSRANQMAYLAQLGADKWLDKDFKEIFENAKKENNLNIEEKAILRNIDHSAKFYFKVPKKLIVEYSHLTSKSFMVWQKAKVENKFEDFAPYLEKLIDKNIEIANYVGYDKNPYDALLDMYEPGLKTSELEIIFDELVKNLSPLVKKLASNNQKSILRGTDKTYSVDSQIKIANYVLGLMGYDFEGGRMDVSSHPFTSTLGLGDVRITNRYKNNDFIESIMVAMHEGGHAIYDQGVNPDYFETPLDGGVSLGIHESQSRFWENQIGRSKEFINFIFPLLKSHYGNELNNSNSEDIYFEATKVNPSLIRTDADEVTYNLHVALRFELENALINKKIKVKELPTRWKEKMKKYLAVVPDTDREGVLQDVHWSEGMFGYFPTYTLGNLYSAQFTHFMEKSLDIKKLVSEGNFKPMLDWLRSNIHTFGSRDLPDDLAQKITGVKLNPKYFIDYIDKKYNK